MTVFERTLDYVLMTPKTKRQVEMYLRRKKVDAEEAASVIDRLVDLGYINDAAYAELFVEGKSLKLGKNAIRNKLYQRGVRSELVEKEVSKIEDQTELCRMVAEKYMRNKIFDAKVSQKLYSHLVYKGFEYETVQEVVSGYKDRD